MKITDLLILFAGTIILRILIKSNPAYLLDCFLFGIIVGLLRAKKTLSGTDE